MRLLALLLSLVIGGTSFGAILAAGDGSDVWVVYSGDEREVTILHRVGGTGSSEVNRTGSSLHGRLAPHGIAAANGVLWLVYDDLNVQTMHHEPADALEMERYRTQTELPLPSGVTLRSLAAGKRAWALVRVEHADKLAAIDAPPKPKVLDEDEEDQPVKPAETPPPAEEPAAVAEPVPPPQLPADRLLELSADGWRNIALPDDWLHGASAWVLPSQTDETPHLLVIHTVDDRTELLQYRRSGEGWTRSERQLPDKGSYRPACISAQASKHLVLADPIDDETQLRLRILLLRDEGLNELGELAVEGARPHDWALVDAGGTHPIGVLSWTKQGDLTLTQMDWQGNPTRTASLLQRQTQEWLFRLDIVVLLTALVLATLIMLALWRRETTGNPLKLPATLVLADLSRRAFAGAIDLAPCLIVTGFYFGWSEQDWLLYWPGYHTNHWHDLIPRAVMIAIFVSHTTLTELFTARTLGKYLTGLRVTNMRGQPPNIWQVLLRNLMKVFELVAVFLLVLPWIAPYRQRLGDMAARTVVVMNPEEEKEEDEAENE